MKNGTKNYIGDDSISHRRKATQNSLEPLAVHDSFGRSEKRIRNQKRQEPVRPGSFGADGFLRTQFLPKTNTIETSGKSADEIYHSLDLLCEFYGITPTAETKHLEYPYNVSIALINMREQMNKIDIDIQNGNFVSIETYNTGSMLYYISVQQVYEILETRKETARLLINIFRYLYKIADVPYYRDEYTHMWYIYEMFSDWTHEDPDMDVEDIQMQCDQLQKAWAMGDQIDILIRQGKIEDLESSVLNFKPADEIDSECLKLAKTSLKLYQDYPNTSIFRAGNGNDSYMDEDNEGLETITMHKYISFVHNTDSRHWLYDSIEQHVNMEFNECGSIDEPSVVRVFSPGVDYRTDSLDFENRIFSLIDDLCALLDRIDSEICKK